MRINTRVSDNNNLSDGKITRRDFLKALAWGGTGLALGGMGFFNMKNNNNSRQFAFAEGNSGGGGRGDAILPMSESERKKMGFEIRKRAAERTYGIEWPDHKNNGEEDDYREDGHRTYIANYSKGLMHNKLGEPDRESYESFLRAAKSPSFAVWEKVQLGTFEEPHFRL